MKEDVITVIKDAGDRTVLDLSNRDLTALPPEIGQLSRLEGLFLDGNRLTSLPREIGNLVNLRQLDLRDNQLTTLPPEFKKLTNLTELRLEGNPLPIPPEILSLAHRPTQIIDFYLLQHQPKQLKPLNEAKMLIVGEGGVGKTSLVSRLTKDTYDPRQGTTHGIEINRLYLDVDGEEIRLNIWDFGGQEIMHATHQFFFTKRSLYLLVLDARRGLNESLSEYWLKLIQSLSADSPVIVAINKSDLRAPDIDRRWLRTKYENIKAFVNVSSHDGTGIAELKRHVMREAAGLEHVHDQLPGSWLKLKARLEDSKRDYITLQVFTRLCLEEGIQDEVSQKTLLGFLNDLGTVLNFQDDSRLSNTIVIRPEWLVTAVYKILSSSELFKNKGVLNLERLGQILASPEYSESERKFIIGVMEKFELGFAFDNEREFLIPDLLPSEAPDLNWNYNDNLAFRYFYNFLPQSVVTRLIVRMRKYVQQSSYWRNGVIFRHKDNRALILADMEDKKLSIHVSGRQQTRREFLEIIRATLDEIHQSFRGLEVKGKVPLPDYPEIVVDYEHLLNLEKLGIDSFVPEGLMTAISVKQLLNGVEPESSRKISSKAQLEGKRKRKRSSKSISATGGISEPLPTPPYEPVNRWMWTVPAWLLIVPAVVLIVLYFLLNMQFMVRAGSWRYVFLFVLGIGTSLLAFRPLEYFVSLQRDPAFREANLVELWIEALRRSFWTKGATADSQQWKMYPVWSQQIREELLATNQAKLTRFPRDLRRSIGERFMKDFPQLNLTFDWNEMKLRVSELKRLDSFREAWEGAKRLIDANSIERFRDEADRLTELFCEAVAFERFNQRSTLGRLYADHIDASNPAFELMVNVRPEFPLIFACKRNFSEDDVRNATGLMNRFGVGEDGFALLVAFDKDQSLRQLVQNSPHKNDFTVLNQDQLWELLAAKSPVQRLQELILEQIDLVAVSPYTTAGPVTGKGFFGRAKEEETLTKNIRRNDFALLANRKMGKTSLLERVVTRLKRTEYYQVFHCDLQTSQDYRKFYRKLIKTYPDLRTNRGKTGEPSVEDFANIVEQIRARDDSRIVFVFDEVDELLAYDMQYREQLFKTFRSLAQRENVRFIFSGTTTLVERVHNPDSPLFNFCKVVKLGLLDEKSARDLVTVPMGSIKVGFEDEAATVERILAVSARHPNLIQAICERLVDRINDNQRRVITLADLNSVIDSDDFYTFFEELVWGNATEMEKLIVYTMWRRQEFTADEVMTALSKHNIPVEAIKNSLNTLEIYSILSRDAGRYSFTYDEFRGQIEARSDVDVLAEQYLQEVLNLWRPS